GSVFVNRPVTIRAVPIGNGAIAQTVPSDSKRGYSFALVTGTYDRSVDENMSTSRDLRYQNLQSDRISLSVGESGLSHDLAIVARSRVHGNVTLSGSAVSTALTLHGPEERTTAATTVGYEVYLIPGTYVVSANETIH